MSSKPMYPNISTPFSKHSPTAPSFSTTEDFSDGATMAGQLASIPTTQIEMSISCRNLLNKDTFSKSDPFCVVLMRNSWQTKFYELGRTETIQDCLSPEWVKKFIINYNFEIVQQIRFEFYDKDFYMEDFLGFHETTLAEIVSYSSRQYIRPLVGLKQKKCGEVIVVTEEVSTCKQIVQMQFTGDDLPRFFCGLCSAFAFLVISRSNEDGTFSVVHKTECYRPSEATFWQTIKISVRKLCNGDYDRTIRIDCYDHRSNGSHVQLGYCMTTFRELLSKQRKIKLNLQKLTGAKIGALSLRWIQVTNEITFLDYIKSGTQMHFAVAIDFTASNGSPFETNSLHHIDPTGQRRNPYEIALCSIGELIQQYNVKGIFPAFGFGAKLPPTGEVSHHFPLNGNASYPYCSSIEEILMHYRNRLRTVGLFGPTNFALVIANTAHIASQFQNGKHYFILLIITDGIISDMYQTTNEIIAASSLPLSIIIVGVGNANFDPMDKLDSDGVLLRNGDQVASRDIVQFVRMNKFLTHERSFMESQADLAREVLAEIPQQMIGYMKANGFTPEHVSRIT